MSRHISRRDRWTSHGPGGYRSVEGLMVRRFKGEWWAEVAYQVREETPEDGTTGWTRHEERIGPFRRSRNAMVEAERRLVMLRNRHGERMKLVAIQGDPFAD